MGSGYTSSNDRVYQSDFGDVVDVLAGPSRWQPYILPNLKISKSAPRSFKVLTVDKFKEKTGYGTNVPGVTYKQTGDIIMQEWGVKDATFLSAALHECVHLVSDPARQGAKESSARSKLGEGLLEGLVETVTQNILSDQNITLAPAGMRGHAKRVAIINDLMPEECIPIFARVLFQGADAQLSLVMDLVYSKSGWNNIKNLATADQTDLARKVMATRTMSRNTQTLLDTVLKMIP